MKNPLRKLSSGLRSRLFKDAASDDDTVFLLSSGRSGSTWLSAMLQSIPSTRTVFEPFHATRGYEALAPYRYRYLRPEDDVDILNETLSGVLNGHLRSDWADQFNPLFPTTFRRRLIKEVRINLLAPWLTRAFPDARYLFLIRHPIPLAMSQLNGGWNLSSRRLSEQIELAERYDLHRFSRFRWPTSGFESLVLFWAIENLVAFQCARDSGSLLVRYEDLVLRPEQSLKAVQRHIRADIPEQVWQTFTEASWSSRKAIAGLSPTEKVNRWQRTATKSQVAFVGRVLDSCELGSIYDADSVQEK